MDAELTRHIVTAEPGRTSNRAGRNFYKDGRHFYYGANGSGRTRDYHADLGFTRRTNSNNEGIYFGYNSEPKPKARMISWRTNHSANIDFNWQGRSQGWGEESNVSFNFQHNTYFGVGLANGYERLFEEEFGVKRTKTQLGAFFDGPERSTRQYSPYSFGGTNPSKKYSITYFAGYAIGSVAFDFVSRRKVLPPPPPPIASPHATLA